MRRIQIWAPKQDWRRQPALRETDLITIRA
jgi:hypothetical protein